MVSGTCIVAIKTPKEIIVGADSARNVAREDTALVCKIGLVGDIVFTTAGLAEVSDDETLQVQFAVQEIVRASIDPALVVSSNLDRIVAAIRVKANAYCRSASDCDKMKFLMGLSGSPIEVALYRYENEALKLAARRLKQAAIDRLCLVEEVPTYHTAPGLPGIELYLAGSQNAICRHLGSNPITSLGDPVSAVRDLIQIEISNDPKSVSKPIRIVGVMKSEIKWKQGTLGCA